MQCQVCDCELSLDEEEGYTCFDCIVMVSQGLHDVEMGNVTDIEDVIEELG